MCTSLYNNYFIFKNCTPFECRVRGATNLEELEMVWSEVKHKGIHHDQTLSDLYTQKKESFLNNH